MIIHNPKISGSLQFPSDENGNLITLQVQNGTLETINIKFKWSRPKCTTEC